MKLADVNTHSWTSLLLMYEVTNHINCKNYKH